MTVRNRDNLLPPAYVPATTGVDGRFELKGLPTGATSPAGVTVGAITSMADVVMVPVVPPTITSVSPAVLAQGIHTTMTVKGTGFQAGASFVVDSPRPSAALVTNIQVVDAQTLVADVL